MTWLIRTRENHLMNPETYRNKEQLKIFKPWKKKKQLKRFIKKTAVLRSLTKFFQLDKSGLTDMNFRNHCKLNASIFLSADPGVIVVKAIKGNKWAFLLWKLCYTVLYNLKIWQIILTSQNVAKMMWTYFLRIDRKGLSNMFDCFLTVKAYQGQIITIFFFEISSHSILYIWNQLVLSAPSDYFQRFFQITNLKNTFCAFRAAWGKQSIPETLKFLLVCFASTCKLILMERSVSHNETDIQKISNKKKTIK